MLVVAVEASFWIVNPPVDGEILSEVAVAVQEIRLQVNVKHIDCNTYSW